MTKFRYNGRDVDAEALAKAATNVLHLLENMTTDEFSRGHDRLARLALSEALGYSYEECP